MSKEMKKPTVWVIKEQMTRTETGSIPMDYSKAMDYGDLKFITTHDIPLYGGASSTQDGWNEDVAAFASQYDPDHDFIITTGQPMAIFMVGWILALLHHEKDPQFLVWRREENRYRPVRPDISKLDS